MEEIAEAEAKESQTSPRKRRGSDVTMEDAEGTEDKADKTDEDYDVLVSKRFACNSLSKTNLSINLDHRTGFAIWQRMINDFAVRQRMFNNDYRSFYF